MKNFTLWILTYFTSSLSKLVHIPTHKNRSKRSFDGRHSNMTCLDTQCLVTIDTGNPHNTLVKSPGTKCIFCLLLPCFHVQYIISIHSNELLKQKLNIYLCMCLYTCVYVYIIMRHVYRDDYHYILPLYF